MPGHDPEVLAPGSAHDPLAAPQPVPEAPPEAPIPRPRQRAGGGTVARTSATRSWSGSSPAIRRASATSTGALTPACSTPGRAAGPTPAPPRPVRFARGSRWPAPPRPAARRRGGYGSRRQRGGQQIAGAGEADERFRSRAQGLGPAPHLGEDVARRCSGGVRSLRLGRLGRQRGRVLAAPASSTPTGALDTSHTTPARVRRPRAAGRAPAAPTPPPARLPRGPSPGRAPARRGARDVRSPARVPVRSSAAARRVRRGPSSRHDRGLGGDGAGQRIDQPGERRGGHARNTRSALPRLAGDGSTDSCADSSTPGR